MVHAGGCFCGAVRFEVEGESLHTSLCHCSDCRRSAGAPVVAWAAFHDDRLRVTRGETKTINSSGATFRSFCPHCGTGLFYRNAAMLPGIVDIQIVAMDEPEAFPPQVQIQTAERIGWMEQAHSLPAFERFPPVA